MSEEIVSHHDFSIEGKVLLIDKPLNWTSFDIVKKVRVLFRCPESWTRRHIRSKRDRLIDRLHRKKNEKH